MGNITLPKSLRSSKEKNGNMMKWKTIETKYLTVSPYFTSRVDRCMADGGKIVPAYYVVELPTSVCAVCITSQNEVLVVKQYRHPIEEICIELPGGFVNEGETPDQAIKRELQEETAYEFEEYIPLGRVAANPGVLNNYTYFFLAKNGKPHGKQKLDENEFLNVEKISIAGLKHLLNEHQLLQSLHANCAYYALKELGKI